MGFLSFWNRQVRRRMHGWKYYPYRTFHTFMSLKIRKSVNAMYLKNFDPRILRLLSWDMLGRVPGTYVCSWQSCFPLVTCSLKSWIFFTALMPRFCFRNRTGWGKSCKIIIFECSMSDEFKSIEYWMPLVHLIAEFFVTLTSNYRFDIDKNWCRQKVCTTMHHLRIKWASNFVYLRLWNYKLAARSNQKALMH